MKITFKTVLPIVVSIFILSCNKNSEFIKERIKNNSKQLPNTPITPDIAGPQISLSFTYPTTDNVVISGLDIIRGNVSGIGVSSVGILIIKEDTDEEWGNITPTIPGGIHYPVYGWKTAYTGEYLEAELKRFIFPNTWTWQTPNPKYSYYLPNGSSLPNGRYIIYALAKTTTGVQVQINRHFIIAHKI